MIDVKKTFGLMAAAAALIALPMAMDNTQPSSDKNNQTVSPYDEEPASDTLLAFADMPHLSAPR